MKFNPSDYAIPTSLGEAVSLLDHYGEKATIIAGGVTFYEIAKRGLLSDTNIIVDISKLDLDRIHKGNGGLVIGSMVTFSQLLQHMEQHLKSKSFGAMYDVVSKFVPYQVRTLATIGGSVCSALPFLDMPVALSALGATIRTESREGRREIGIDQFYVGLFQTVLKRAEIVTEISVKRPSTKTGSAFQNLKRTGLDIPVLSVACSVTMEESEERIQEIRVALGGVQEKVVRLPSVEQALLGESPTTELISKNSETAVDFDPIASVHVGSTYKREVAKVLLREVITSAVSRANGRDS